MSLFSLKKRMESHCNQTNTMKYKGTKPKLVLSGKMRVIPLDNENQCVVESPPDTIHEDDETEVTEEVSLQVKVRPLIRNQLKELAVISKLTLQQYCTALFEDAVDNDTTFSFKITKN